MPETAEESSSSATAEMAEESANQGGYKSIKYYALKNENARTFYDEWKLKTMAIIRKNGINKTNLLER